MSNSDPADRDRRHSEFGTDPGSEREYHRDGPHRRHGRYLWKYTCRLLLRQFGHVDHGHISRRKSGHGRRDRDYPNGTSTTSPADQFTFVTPGPPPNVTSVTPNAGTTAGGIVFAVTGTGFTGTNAVNVGKTPAPFVINSDTSLTVTSPVEQAGTLDVTVTNPNGTSISGPDDQFTVIAPQPVVTSVGPSMGTADGGGSVTISGSGFTFATAVNFGVCQPRLTS